jgi:CRISPR type IV-associated protein Csf2
MNMTQTYSFVGTVVAETPLAVSRPGDNFMSSGESEKVQRLPRRGPKIKSTPVFFPASTINGSIRRAATNIVRRALVEVTGEDKPFTLDEFYMLVQGVDTAQILTKEASETGLVEEENELRQTNPFISLFGRWGLPGHLAIGDAIPDSDQGSVMYLTGNGCRADEFERKPEQVNFLSSEDKSRLVEILRKDALAQKDINAMKDRIKEIKKSMKTLSDPEKDEAKNSISNLEASIQEAKSAKAGAAESIKRPLDGYECIAPGTRMSHKMVVSNATEIELGLFIHSLAEFSRDPRMGAHTRQGAGEVSASWDVKIRPVDSWQAITVGRVNLSSEEFSIEDLTDDKVLSSAVEVFSNAIKNLNSMDIDFKRFAKIAN